MRRCATSLLLCTLAGLAGCNFDNPGDPPPEALIYLPAALRLSSSPDAQAARYLYVVNSNFDLRYNAGSLQAYDLDELDAEIGRCRTPGADCEIDPDRVYVDEVLVPSFATGLASATDHGRLYVVTRREAQLNVVDVDEGGRNLLSCDDEDRRCSPDYARGGDPILNEGRGGFPAEPVGLTAGKLGDLVEPGADPLPAGDADADFVVVAHREGYASLFVEVGGELRLVHVMGDLLSEPTGITFDPFTRLNYMTVRDRSLSGALNERLLGRIGVALTGPESSAVPAYLYDAQALSLTGVISERDTHAVAMNPAMPGEALVVARYPSSLIYTDVVTPLAGDSRWFQAPVRHSVAVGAGPSRIDVGKLGDRTVAVVSCFDARQIYVLDAVSGEPLSIVHNFSGPFSVALDSVRRRLYVADFKASVVRVLDLSHIVEGATESVPSARIVATLGHPQLVEELQ